MTRAGWLQLFALVAMVAASSPFLGRYLAGVFGGEPGRGDRVFGGLERLVYRACGVDPGAEQRWPTYARSLLAFSVVSTLVVYALARLQGHLPLNPTGVKGQPALLAFNTVVSFLTNTNWQNYAGESGASYLLQMAGLAVQNFVSAAVGLAVAVALIRGLVRRRSQTIGNFWVDLVRGVVRVLVPLAFVGAVVLVSQGVVQNLHGFRAATTLEGRTQLIPGGPVASQEVIKELGTNGGGFYNANAAHPFENPNPLTNLVEMWLILAVPFALPFTFGRMAKDRRQGWVVFGAMFVLWAGSAVLAMQFETNGNPQLTRAGADQSTTVAQAGGNMEGKELRFGPAGSALFAATATGTSTGAVDAAHDSFTPGGGGVVLANMMLGEISPGGVGSGLYSMLVFALLTVFIAGLMVGRTPEYLGKKIQAAEMKLVVLYILVVPVVVLSLAGASVLLSSAVSSIANPGPHGLSEIVYAFTSAANNNGSAFAGLSANTDWYNTTLGLAMLAGRFLTIIPVLGIAGALAAKQPAPPTAGTFPTGTPLFAGLLVGVVLVVGGLTYFPVLALGPIVEHLGL
ncbi:MAG: potassium-transporting ATPase subunit KdpA [Acidimicrobiia bacterium]